MDGGKDAIGRGEDASGKEEDTIGGEDAFDKAEGNECVTVVVARVSCSPAAA